MAIKKVGESDELQAELVKTLANKNSELRKNSAGSLELLKQSSSEEQRVNVGLSQLINSELNPTALEAERKEKIKKLKEMIDSGQYNPSSTVIAEAVGREIAFEILSNPKSSKDDIADF